MRVTRNDVGHIRESRLFTLDEVVPWGRSFDEYRLMFSLDNVDPRARILGCGDGPASFNAEATRLGIDVVSCDPLYGFEPSQISQRIAETREQILEQTRQNTDGFVWSYFVSIDELARARDTAMRRFLEDFETGAGRYVDASLPELPFSNGAFSLAVCSHFLFLYSQQLTTAFHLAALDELCRVASEVRVFPVVALGGVESPHLQPVIQHLVKAGHETAIEDVDYEFQRGASQMLKISSCQARSG